MHEQLIERLSWLPGLFDSSCLQMKSVLTIMLLLCLHICSLAVTRGCLQDHFLQILPEAEVEAINAMYTEAAEEQLLGGKPDYVLDAIDNIDTKVALLAACHRKGIPVLSSAGAGGDSPVPKRLF